ncbi:MAG: hypothetical protein HQK55_01770 [Deltaproteobacteria bacterium]|nr:hypothetical protein [Deltaproteobacteria bacterium]
MPADGRLKAINSILEVSPPLAGSANQASIIKRLDRYLMAVTASTSQGGERN